MRSHKSVSPHSVAFSPHSIAFSPNSAASPRHPAASPRHYGAFRAERGSCGAHYGADGSGARRASPHAPRRPQIRVGASWVTEVRANRRARGFCACQDGLLCVSCDVCVEAGLRLRWPAWFAMTFGSLGTDGAERAFNGLIGVAMSSFIVRNDGNAVVTN